jgi:hypothetical protein
MALTKELAGEAPKNSLEDSYFITPKYTTL